MRNILLTSFILACTFVNGNSQDNIKLGIRGGLGISNQYWQYIQPQFEWVSGKKENQKGFELYLTSEVPLTNYLSLKPEFGIIEKGFYSDPINRDITSAGGSFEKNTVETINLSLNILAKLQLPFKSKIRPYVLSGLKLDHLIEVNDWLFTVNGNLIDDYHDFIFSDYKEIISSGLVGFGIEWNDYISFEYQYNFSFMSSTENNSIQVTDRYQGITVGVMFLRTNKDSGM